ncbi:tetratricopeptide repeat protein [Deinococcus sp. YIM 77859]|uniref:tetratricopeptide repeat protein n=1 Tax=Deinococcus sp. YIM 77859 TaxID=1540221 RepID=UPI00055521C9|nr:tetratricopeptide repeat protein [Deinococcus sp. YIM 77859]
MIPLPEHLRLRLAAEPDRVVLPVDVGAGQEALVAWARARGLTVTREPPVSELRWLWWPRRRADLMTWAAQTDSSLPLLVLSGTDTRYTEQEWRAAVRGAPAWAASTFALSRGWPAALPLALALAESHASDREEWYRHPLAGALLAPLLPPGPLLAAYRALALTPLVTPQVAAALHVSWETVEVLADRGWLWAVPGGWELPGVLRRHLCPLPDPQVARPVAALLHQAGFTAAALTLLREAGAWDEHLTLLAQELRVGSGPEVLRATLRALPPYWREQPAALYLAGLLARASGDLERAEALYSRALPVLPPALQPLAANARGVVRAVRGDAAGALEDFGEASRVGGLTGGEAAHNRATLLVQLGRHADAEQSLDGAIAAFREAGDLRREARSLETLGSLQFGRGLLQEALVPYEQVLRLLQEDHPEETALTHVNLAEVRTLLGEEEQARAHLERAQALTERFELTHVTGWITRVRALLALHAGLPQVARDLLEAVPSADRSLQAETQLLLARACRELGEAEAARAALAEARALGLRADLEAALQGADDVGEVIEAARQEEARLELATALLHRAEPQDLEEALDLIRTHGYRALLRSPAAHRLVTHAQDDATRALFPLVLRVLGPLRVTQAGRVWRSADFPTRKSAALLVALALSGRSQPREQLAERFWPDAKNPLASLQTAVYHLRSTFGVNLIRSARGRLTLTFPVHSDLADLQEALAARDPDRIAALIRQETTPPAVLPDLAAELHEECELAERLLHDALRVYADAQPEGSLERRDALRNLIAADPLNIEARTHLVDWHLGQGDTESAQQERARMQDILRELDLG